MKFEQESSVRAHLTSHGNLAVEFKTERALLTFRVVEHNGHAGFCDARLTTLVNEVLLVLRAHLKKKGGVKIQRRAGTSNNLRRA
jgi:hypothetical protein